MADRFISRVFDLVYRIAALEADIGFRHGEGLPSRRQADKQKALDVELSTLLTNRDLRVAEAVRDAALKAALHGQAPLVRGNASYHILALDLAAIVDALEGGDGDSRR